MAKATVLPRRDAEQIKGLLRSPEVVALIADLEATRWTGRPGYPIRTMVGLTLVKSLYVLPTWTRTVRLVAEHATLRKAIGGAPSVDACYRFTRKLREHKTALDTCIAAVIASLHAELDYGQRVAIDGSDLPAYANGQRFVSKGGRLRERFSDPDASWGHRSAVSTRKGGGFYGDKVTRRRLHRYRSSGGMGDAHGPRRRGSRRAFASGQDRWLRDHACRLHR